MKATLNTKTILKKIKRYKANLIDNIAGKAKEALHMRARVARGIVRDLLSGNCRRKGRGSRYPDMPGKCSGNLERSFKYRTMVSANKDKGITLSYIAKFHPLDFKYDYAEGLHKKGSRNNPQIAGYKERVGKAFYKEIKKVSGDIKVYRRNR